MPIDIRLDTSEFAAQIEKLAKPHIPLMRALNRSIQSGQVLGARLVSQDMGIKVSTAKEFIKVKRASAAVLEATIYASAKRVPLIDFNAKGREPSLGIPGGVRAKLKGGPGRYPHAFVATMGSGHRGVFKRRGEAKRLPIDELHGPSAWKAFQSVEQQVKARTQEQLIKNVASELAYALSKSGSPTA